MLKYTDLLRPLGALISLIPLYIVVMLARIVISRQGSSRLPRLKGPPNQYSFLGRLPEVLQSKDRAGMYQRWTEEYGAVFQVPGLLGGRSIILCDPKAIAHLHSKDSLTYQALPFAKMFMKKIVSWNEPHYGVNSSVLLGRT